MRVTFCACMSRVIMPASIGWGIVFEKATKEALEQALCVKGVHLAFYPTSNLSMSDKKGGEERASSYHPRSERRGAPNALKLGVKGGKEKASTVEVREEWRRRECEFLGKTYHARLTLFESHPGACGPYSSSCLSCITTAICCLQDFLMRLLLVLQGVLAPAEVDGQASLSAVSTGVTSGLLYSSPSLSFACL